jgi:predicted TIM-barrel fold metal-dependent hydrolase
VPTVDCHTHVFCWGERPEEGFLSERLRRRWLTRLIRWLTRIDHEPGADLSAKMRHRLLRDVRASRLDYAVVLAQDARYRADGSRDDAGTHFFVSNDYVLALARDEPRIVPGCSINPWRADALAELERIAEAGGRLVKVHTAIQGVDPALPQFDPFYRRAAELGVTLMFHTGYEHSSQIVSQQFTDPERLARPLGHGGRVIAAHCGTCAFFDPEDYYPRFVRMMTAHDNLYGDTAVLASLIRPRALRRLEREPAELRSRLLHGSDYPLPPSRVPYLARVGLLPPERRNPLDLDLRIKQSFDLGPRYAEQVLELLGIEGASGQRPAVVPRPASSRT